ncbi:hypothetical protein E2C01_047000 [Portunus trituberculatus]|uniref:Uncharacterized protein n=1 Tax=Portunus trituberculatus TaxID=210409 RepID=A0A5B7G6R2_PORTR|nr:hypothetical protein [Portunus trituberculatus]
MESPGHLSELAFRSSHLSGPDCLAQVSANRMKATPSTCLTAEHSHAGPAHHVHLVSRHTQARRDDSSATSRNGVKPITFVLSPPVD